MKLLLSTLSLFILFRSHAQAYEVEEMRLVATIQTIEGINEKTDEFCPVVSNDRIYFTSSRQYNKNSVGESNWEKNGYLNVFDGAILTDDFGDIYIKDIRLMSNKIKTKNHTGPVSFTKSGDTLFFTQVVQVAGGKKNVLNPQLFMAVRQKDKWKKIKLLPFSDGVNSFGHPSFDIRDNRLYFASNKPGGKGQRDIYYSEIKNGQWSTPVSVDAINTANDEKFPFAIGGNIFFSSDRENGNGDMDIYYSSPEPADYPIKLEGLNSDFDDFGVSLLPDLSAGYFSSNRDGSDDIFYFTIERVLTVKNQLSGRFTFQNLDAATSDDLSLQIVNEEGDFVYEEDLNNDGEFTFENILLDSNFSVKLKGNKGTENMVLEFYNEEGNTTANFILDEEGSFHYKKMFYDYGGVINFIPDNMKDFDANTGNLSGKLVFENDPNKTLSNATVNLVDEDENIVMTTQTDTYGNFEFNDLSLESNYFLQMPDCSDELVMYIYESEDIIYTQLKCNSNDYFMYRRLKPTDEYDLTLLTTDDEREFMLGSSEITGRFQPKDGLRKAIQCQVNIFDEGGILLATTQSDSLGYFRFDELVAGETSYQFSAGSNEPLLLTLYNRYGDAVAIIEEEEGLFIFRPLGFKSESELSLVDEDIEFDLKFSDQYEAVVVYYDPNKSSVKSGEIAKIDRIYNLMKRYKEINLSVSAYADANASNEYNFALSQKRAKWIVDYLVSKGINKSRFTTNAYGENRLIDPENDALNRRSELRIYK